MKYSQGWTISKEFEQLSRKAEQSAPTKQQSIPQIDVTYSQMKQNALALMLDYAYGKEVNSGFKITTQIGNQRKVISKCL